MNWFLFVLGILIIIITFLDFFHTTISSHGYGYFSDKLNNVLKRIILSFQSTRIYKFSGLIHLLVNSFFWLSLLVLGSFIIFYSSDQMVVQGSTMEPATAIQRFYYTCYVISTTGIGNFIPGSPQGEIAVAILSFTGFLMLTLAITYFLSVLNAVNHKKGIAVYITSMGENPEKLYDFFNNDGKLAFESESDLKMLIINHTTNHLSFPIIESFISPQNRYNVPLQFASLYEVLRVLMVHTDKGSRQWKNLNSILDTIKFYLKSHVKNISGKKYDPEKLKKLREVWQVNYGIQLEANDKYDELLFFSLKNSGKDWEDVYSMG